MQVNKIPAQQAAAASYLTPSLSCETGCDHARLAQVMLHVVSIAFNIGTLLPRADTESDGVVLHVTIA